MLARLFSLAFLRWTLVVSLANLATLASLAIWILGELASRFMSFFPLSPWPYMVRAAARNRSWPTKQTTNMASCYPVPHCVATRSAVVKFAEHRALGPWSTKQELTKIGAASYVFPHRHSCLLAKTWKELDS